MARHGMAEPPPDLKTSGAIPSSRIAFKIRKASSQRPHCAQAAMALLKANTVGLRKGCPQNAGGMFVSQGISRKGGCMCRWSRGFQKKRAACFVVQGTSRKRGQNVSSGGFQKCGQRFVGQGFSENAGGMFRRSRDFQKKRDACFVGQRQFARQRTPTKKTCTKKYKAEVHHREKKKFGRRYRMPGFEGIPYT